VDRRDVSPRLGCQDRECVPAPSGIGRHKPAKQNQSSPVFVNSTSITGPSCRQTRRSATPG
jgi:hypothetical protein